MEVAELPAIKYFFGREGELKEVEDFLRSKTQKILVLRGIAGIGKTTLLAKLIELFGRDRPTLFYRLYELGTRRGLLEKLAEFLSSLKKDELRKYLSEKEVELDKALRLFQEGFRGSNALIVFDDYQKASEEVKAFFSPIKDACERTDVKIIISGRTIKLFYDRRDVVVKGLVKEAVLGGLDERASKELLVYRRIAEAYHERLYSITKGHPLLLELVEPETIDEAMEFLREEILTPLTERERKVLEIASAFRRPFPARAVEVEDIGYDVIEALVEKSMLERVDNLFRENEIVKDFFYGRMMPSRRAECHRISEEFYRREGEGEALLERIYHLAVAGDQNGAARLVAEGGEGLIVGGYAKELLRLLDLLNQRSVPSYWDQMLFLKGEALSSLGELDSALRCYSDSVAYRRAGDLRGLWFPVSPVGPRAYFRAADIYLKMDKREEAMAMLGHAMRGFEELGDREGVAQVHEALAEVHSRAGDVKRALEHLKSALDLFTGLGVKAGMARVGEKLKALERGSG